MKLRCPECGKSHRVLPERCVIAARRDNDHANIATLSSGNNGSALGVVDGAKQRWDAMKAYLDVAQLASGLKVKP